MAARFGCAGPPRAGAPEDWAPRRVQSIDPSIQPSIYPDTHTHTHHIHTIHTYIHTYILLTYRRTYIHTYIHTFVHSTYNQTPYYYASIIIFSLISTRTPTPTTPPPPKHLHLTHTPSPTPAPAASPKGAQRHAPPSTRTCLIAKLMRSTAGDVPEPLCPRPPTTPAHGLLAADSSLFPALPTHLHARERARDNEAEARQA